MRVPSIDLLSMSESKNDSLEEGSNQPPHRAQRAMRAARKRAGLSQEVAADAVGVTQSTYARWETSHVMLDLHKLEILAKLFKVKMSVLFLEDEEIIEQERIIRKVEDGDAFYIQSREQKELLERRIEQLEQQVKDLRKSADYQDELIKALKQEINRLKSDLAACEEKLG